MDIDLLSKMISELIVDHDRVGLPGVGTFYTEVVPSTFSDRGYTINPPYRRLSFLPNAVENDLLVNFYSDVNGTPADMAREYIVQFLRELAEALKEHKTITLPGLGRLRATKENNFFFVADEDLDIYPEAFGLAPVSLKNIPGLDDDKVDIRFEFKPPVRKAAEPEPAYAASVEPAEPEITVEPAEPVGPAELAVSAELSTTASSEVSGAEPDAAAPETSEPSAPAAEPVSGVGTSAAAETAAMQEPASESAEGAEVFPGTDATAEPAGTAVIVEPAVAVEPTESAALSASAATAAVAEPTKVAASAEAAAPAVPAETATSAELSETAEPSESAKPAELIEPAEPAVAAEPAVTAEPEASMQEPEAPEAAVAGDATAEPAEPEALADAAEEARVAEEDDGRTVKKFRWWIPLLVLSALAAIFLAVFLILAHVAPDFIDSILYTPEELRIINY